MFIISIYKVEQGSKYVIAYPRENEAKTHSKLSDTSHCDRLLTLAWETRAGLSSLPDVLVLNTVRSAFSPRLLLFLVTQIL